MHIDKTSCPFPLSPGLIRILEEQMEKARIPDNTGAILTFRDPTYCPEEGGFHPVEISVTPDGRILYITDFAYVGRPPFSELAKEIDFDFSLGLLQHFGQEFPIDDGRELFELWQANFLAYHELGVYTVAVEKT